MWILADSLFLLLLLLSLLLISASVLASKDQCGILRRLVGGGGLGEGCGDHPAISGPTEAFVWRIGRGHL